MTPKVQGTRGTLRGPTGSGISAIKKEKTVKRTTDDVWGRKKKEIVNGKLGDICFRIRGRKLQGGNARQTQIK